MRDDHDVFDAEFANGDQERAHDAAERVRYFGTGDFDDLRVAVFQAERRGQEFDEARVHARDDSEFLVGELVGAVLLEGALGDERAVVFEQGFDGGRDGVF